MSQRPESSSPSPSPAPSRPTPPEPPVLPMPRVPPPYAAGPGSAPPGRPGYGHPQLDTHIGVHPPMQVVPKIPALSLLASFLLPGLGSMVNGEVGKGAAILAGYLVSWLLVIVLVGLVGVVGFWVWGMVDAYQGARAWNLAHGIVG